MNKDFHFGAIFDWDGVIVDSSSSHEESWNQLAREMNKELFEGFFKKSFGMKNTRIIPELLGWTQDPVEIEVISERKEELYREIVKVKGIEALPGAVRWVKELKALGIPCVVASSGHRKNIDLGLTAIGLMGVFDEVVCAQDVTLGKPHPEVFLKAAEKIQVDPNRCIVFEDAHVGIEAAQRAEIKVIALETTHSRETLHQADHVINNLSAMTVDIAKAVLNS